MKWDDDKDEAILSTGRRVYVHGGTIGIDHVGNVSEGHDGSLEPYGEVSQFTPDERREIAIEMVRRWTEWGHLEDMKNG